MSSIQNGGQMTTAAFSQIPVLGSIILVFGIITFAYTTVLGWSYYGERCAEYLFGKRATIFFKIIFVFVILLGPVIELDIVWSSFRYFQCPYGYSKYYCSCVYFWSYC